MDLADMGLMDTVVLGLKLGIIGVATWLFLWGCVYLFMGVFVVAQVLTCLIEGFWGVLVAGVKWLCRAMVFYNPIALLVRWWGDGSDRAGVSGDGD